MRENRTCGSEGGEGESPSRPLSGGANPMNFGIRTLVPVLNAAPMSGGPCLAESLFDRVPDLALDLDAVEAVDLLDAGR